MLHDRTWGSQPSGCSGFAAVGMDGVDGVDEVDHRVTVSRPFSPSLPLPINAGTVRKARARQAASGNRRSSSFHPKVEGEMADRPENIPPGWAYNPASWSQRLPIVALAFLGFLIAGYLSLYQLDVFATVWEPFFGDGSEKVLNSAISHVLPIPDAALGAFAYLVDVVAGVIGGRGRWRTMPWVVIVFGIAVGPLGVVSIMLVVFQPVLLGAWCTLCLASAVISLFMVGPAMDEVLASLQHVKRRVDAGASFWRVLWNGEG